MGMSEKNTRIDPEQENRTAIERSAYLWNTASGLLNAFQSVIMLTVLTHVCDMVTAGVFTLAYANANLFLNLGKYGIRNFQVSDVDEKYDFRSYLTARLITVAAMIIVGSAWLAWSAATVGYSPEKSLTVLMMLAFKAIDAQRTFVNKTRFIVVVTAAHDVQHGIHSFAAVVINGRIGFRVAAELEHRKPLPRQRRREV